MVTRYPGSLGIKVANAASHALFLNVPSLTLLLTLGLGFFVVGLNGLGYPTSIATSYGSVEQVCAIEANGQQEAFCWGRNSSGSSTGLAFSVLSGGNGFTCGLSVGTNFLYCWNGNWSSDSLTPSYYANISYSTIAAGQYHVCGITNDSNGANSEKVNCWGFGDEWAAENPPDNLATLGSLVAGNSYSCGLGKWWPTPSCWGDDSYGIISNIPSMPFESLSGGMNHVCGVLQDTKQVKCWGDNSTGQANPPTNITFSAVTSGLAHSCGITDSTHEVVCWGEFELSTLPYGVSFLTLTSGPNMTCGIREDSLLAMCWGDDDAGTNYSPPLQLFSPGVCTANPCGNDTFRFNASSIMELHYVSTSNICQGSDDQICAPCASTCPSGSFLSNSCSSDADRSCTDCSYCQSESCQPLCVGVNTFPAASPLQSKNTSSGKKTRTAPIIGAAVAGGLLVLIVCSLALCFAYRKRIRYRLWGCASRKKLSDSGGGISSGSLPGGGIVTPRGRRNGVITHEQTIRMQAFQLSELRDATNGFKELNELGRGSYGFVYRAVLPDGRQVAVKRANAARRIQSRSRDFEAELEVLCKVHHAHLVNLIGYCEEMGERLLVYEFMPHGTLHDHLHGGHSQLNWNLRLKVVAQAARGIEYLHKDASPRIIHRDIKSSNILLDAEWGARVADFGLALPERERGPPPSVRPCDVAYVDPEYLRSQTYTEKSDVYSFGVVLLEVLCGRKAYDTDFKPPNIVEFATPYIRHGQSSQILDRSLDLPKNIEPLTRVADIVELCVRSSPDDRPSMSDVASWLEIVGRSSPL